MGPLSSVIRLTLGFLFLGVMTFAVIPVLVLLLPFRIARIYTCNLWGHLVGRSICWFSGARPRVSHRERLNGSMPAIYIMNHGSTLDAFLGIWLCPLGGCGVFKKEIVRVPFYGWIAWLSGHLLLDRANHGKAVDSLKSQADLMRAHKLGVWIMPEGTRSRSGRLQPFKKGFVHLAIATGFPVVPVIAHGANRNWESKTFRFVPMDLDIEVLPPVDTSSWKEETAAEHAAELHAIFAQTLRDEQKPLPESTPLKAA